MDSSSSATVIAVFCKDLRDARRFQQISLADVTESTRITPAFLEALENGRWNEIPPAYLRGYLGLYAQAVGMNREKVLRAFDQMTIPSHEQSKVVYDEGPKILEEPQHAEVTRVKIRTAWFAALSRNRAAVYALTCLMIAAILGLIYISRRSRKPHIELISFEQTQKDYQIQVHSPLTWIPLPEDSLGSGMQSRESFWVKCIGLEAGAVVLTRGIMPPKTISYNAYDTISIEYIHKLTLKISPSGSAICRISDTLALPIKIIPGDTQIFQFPAEAIEKVSETSVLPNPD